MTDKKRNLIFINLLITCIATSFLSTALTTALPPIISEFGIDAAKGQWLTSAYSLAMAIMMPMTAFLITRFSTKKLYLSALGILIAGLLICIFATGFEVMLIGRILQAMSNGITTSMAQVLLLTIYPPEKKGTIMGWYGLSVGAAPVIAPTIAGILVDVASWRMIFIITLVILLTSFVYSVIVFEDVLETTKKKFDFLSFILSGIAFGGVTFGVGNAAGGLLQLKAWLPFVLGIVSGVWFILRQLKIETPFLDIRVFRSRVFTVSVISSMFLYFIMMGSSIMMPLYVQSILGKSATISGLVTLPGSLAMAIVSPYAGKLYDKFGMRMLAIVGSIGLFIPALGMAMLTMNTPIWVAAVLQIVRCIAIGCIMMPFVTWGVTSLSEKETAHGNALLTALRTIAGAIGTAVFVGIMTSVSARGSAIRGMSVAYIFMTVLTVIMLVMEVLFVKKSTCVSEK